MKTAYAILISVLVLIASSCRTIVDPVDPSSSCIIPATDSFRANEVQYTGGIRMFTGTGEVMNPATLSAFIAIHPFFSAAAFTEPYIPVTLYFPSADKATFTSFVSTIHFNAQCEGQNILMQSTDTSRGVAITDTTETDFVSKLFYPQNLNLYSPATIPGGGQYFVTIIGRYLLYPDGNNYFAAASRYYYNLHNTRFQQSTVFQSAVLPPVVPLGAGDTVVFQKGRLTYHKL